MIVLLAELHKLQEITLPIIISPHNYVVNMHVMCFHVAFQPPELAFIVAFTIILFSNFLLPLSPHKKINSKATTDRRAREPKMHFHELQKKENITNMQSCH